VTLNARLDDDRPVVPSFVGVRSENADIVSRDVARLRSPPHVALPRDRHASRTRRARNHRADHQTNAFTLPQSQSSGGGSSSFQGSGRTLGTKADEEERKKQRLAALEAAQKNKKPSAGTDVDAMRAEILRERERRRAAAQAATPAAGGDERKEGVPTNEPARARVAAAASSLVANADPSSIMTLCKIACNAAEDAFGDTAPLFANPENAFALATEEEREAASTRVDRRSVKFANEKVRAAFGVRSPSASSSAADGNAAVAAFVAAGFLVVRENETSLDALGLTLPYTADVRLVSFLVETMASSHPGVSLLAAKIARLAKPGFRRAKAIDPTKPPLGGRRAQAYTPPAVSAAKNMQLDDAFFKRDASEVAEEFARAKARRERESALTTRAWKEREALSRREEDGTECAEHLNEKFAPVTVRVRLPDGTQLRGVFGPREPVGAVRAFVHESLREPFRKFDLSFLGAPLKGDDDEKKTPRDSLTGLRTHNVRDASNASKSVRAIGHKGVGYGEEGTVAGAGLAPSALITFSWAEPARPGENTDGERRVLNDELTRNAQPLE